MKLRTKTGLVLAISALLVGPGGVAHAADGVIITKTLKKCYASPAGKYRDVKLTAVWNDTAGAEATLTKVSVYQWKVLQTGGGASPLYFQPSPGGPWVLTYLKWRQTGGGSTAPYTYAATVNLGQQVATYKIKLQSVSGQTCQTGVQKEPDGY